MPADEHMIGPSGLVLDLNRREVTVNGRPVSLNRREVDLLHVLLSEQGRVVPFEELSRRAWGHEMGGDARFIYTTAWRLRRALEAAGAGEVLESVRGVGYLIRDAALADLDEIALAGADRAMVFFDPHDPDWRLVSANRTASIVAGADIFEHEDLIDFTRSMVDDADWKRIQGAVSEALEQGSAKAIGLRYRRPDGRDLTLDMEFRRLDRQEQRPLMVAEVIGVST